MSQVAISGNASGTGTLTIAAPNTNSNYTLTLPTNTGTLISTASAGTVLQVVSTTKTDIISTSSSSLVDITGMSASITPSSTSNKVLIKVMLGQTGVSVANADYRFQLVRTSTNIGVSTGGSIGNYTVSMYPADSAKGEYIGICFLDSPSTTSSTTYKLQMNTGGGTAYVGRFATNANFGSISTITLMEIAG